MTNQTPNARPFKQFLADALIPLILAGDSDALAEGKFRSNPKVVAAVTSVTPAETPAKVDSPKANAETAAEKRARQLLVRARKAQAAAMAAADDGDRVKSGIKARALVLGGTPLTQVLATINA